MIFSFFRNSHFLIKFIYILYKYKIIIKKASFKMYEIINIQKIK